jgi:hypothetical protein
MLLYCPGTPDTLIPTLGNQPMAPSPRSFNPALRASDSSLRTLPIWIHFFALFCVLLLIGICNAQNKTELRDNYITAELDQRGLISVVGPTPNEVVHLVHDEFYISIDGDGFDIWDTKEPVPTHMLQMR